MARTRRHRSASTGRFTKTAAASRSSRRTATTTRRAAKGRTSRARGQARGWLRAG
jgi:hypothetical protein